MDIDEVLLKAGVFVGFPEKRAELAVTCSTNGITATNVEVLLHGLRRQRIEDPAGLLVSILREPQKAKARLADMQRSHELNKPRNTSGGSVRTADDWACKSYRSRIAFALVHVNRMRFETAAEELSEMSGLQFSAQDIEDLVSHESALREIEAAERQSKKPKTEP